MYCGAPPWPPPSCRAEVLSWGMSLLLLPLSALPSCRSTAFCSPPTACSPAGSGGGSSSSLLWLGAYPPPPPSPCCPAAPGLGLAVCIPPCARTSMGAVLGCIPRSVNVSSSPVPHSVACCLTPVLSLLCELWCCSTGSLALLGWDQTLSHCSRHPFHVTVLFALVLFLFLILFFIF